MKNRRKSQAPLRQGARAQQLMGEGRTDEALVLALEAVLQALEGLREALAALNQTLEEGLPPPRPEPGSGHRPQKYPGSLH